MDIRINEDSVIVFDLDDTLYNELDFLKSAYKHIAQYLEPINWKPLYAFMFSSYRCQMNVFEVISDKYKTDIKVFIDMYRGHKPDIVLFEGVQNVLNSIKNKNGKTGIITDGRSITQRGKIEAFGIVNLIDYVIISDEIGTEKPDQENFKAITTFNYRKSYWYIADNLKKRFYCAK